MMVDKNSWSSTVK